MQDGRRTDGAPRKLTVQARPALDGDQLAEDHAAFDPQSGEPVVNFRFDEAGARRFTEIMTQNVGRPFAIVLDGRILSALVIREPITSGSRIRSAAGSWCPKRACSRPCSCGAPCQPLSR